MRTIAPSILGAFLCSTLLVLALGQVVDAGSTTAVLLPASTANSLAEGTTITVTTQADELTVNGECSLREAIQAANLDMAIDSCPAGAGNDTILLTDGVFKLSLAGSREDNNATGDLDILSSLVISGNGPANTVIDANRIDRSLQILPGAIVSIQGLSIRNGRAADGDLDQCDDLNDNDCNGEPGGGIYNSGRLTITNTDIVQNSSGDGVGKEGTSGGVGGDGGAIFNLGYVALYASNVMSNVAGSSGPDDGDDGGTGGEAGNGGGIANHGDLILIHSLVVNNTAGRHCCRVSRSGNGGGIFNSGVFSLARSTVADNRTPLGGAAAGAGGGLFNRGEGLLVGSDLRNNLSGGEGGAIANHGGSLLILRSTISGNRTEHGGIGSYGEPRSAGRGGGIFNSAALTLANSTVSNNRTGDGTNPEIYSSGGSGGDGGGIYNRGSLYVENASMVHNTAAVTGSIGLPIDNSPLIDGRGGAIANDGGTVSLHNSILSDNHAFSTGMDCWGIFTSSGYNLIQNSINCALQGDNTGNILNRRAWLEALADNGGPTPTHALLPQSPALNTGSCVDSTGASVTEDQRGEARPQGDGCDMGAFESELSYMPPLIYLPLIGNRTLSTGTHFTFFTIDQERTP